MWEVLQGEIKADSKYVNATSLCLCLGGGEVGHFVSVLLDLYSCKQGSFASCTIQCHAATPCTMFPLLSA